MNTNDYEEKHSVVMYVENVGRQLKKPENTVVVL